MQKRGKNWTVIEKTGARIDISETGREKTVRWWASSYARATARAGGGTGGYKGIYA